MMINRKYPYPDLCLLVILILGLSLQAFAGDADPAPDVRWQTALCPVCGKKVRVAMLTPAADSLAGLDHDLYIRVTGPQPEFYLINTCSNCYFSGYLNDFELVLPEKTKDQLKKILKPATPIKADTPQREIDNLDKYELAYQTFRVLGRSDEAFGWLTLRASWVARDLYCNLPKNPQIVKVLEDAAKLVPLPDTATNPADREVLQATKLKALVESTGTSPKAEWAADAVIGLLYRRHGENKAALPFIDLVLGNKNTPAPLRENFVKMKQSMAAEQYWQGRAVEHFCQAVMAGTITPENKPTAKYLLGQLYYRLDRKDDARLWLNEALIDKKLPPDLAKWAKETQALVKGP
jgi:hypothetical protein